MAFMNSAWAGEDPGMNKLACNISLMFLCLFFADSPVCAQEFSALGGLTENTKSGNCSFQWQLDYRRTW
jgi:hypothetical protein